MPAAGSRFRVRVTDSSTPPNRAERPFTILPGGQVTTLTTPPVGSVGTAYAFDIDASLGSAGFALVLGALPDGLAIDASGVISGTPAIAGAFHFTVRQTVAMASVWRSYQILVNGSGAVTGTPRQAEQTFAYDHVFTAAGGVAPYAFSVDAGACYRQGSRWIRTPGHCWENCHWQRPVATSRSARSMLRDGVFAGVRD